MARRRREPTKSKQTLIGDVCHSSIVNAATIYRYWLLEVPKPNIAEPPRTPRPLAYQLTAIHEHYKLHGWAEIDRIARKQPKCAKGGSCINKRRKSGSNQGCTWSEHLGLTDQHFRVDVIRRRMNDA